MTEAEKKRKKRLETIERQKATAGTTLKKAVTDDHVASKPRTPAKAGGSGVKPMETDDERRARWLKEYVGQSSSVAGQGFTHYSNAPANAPKKYTPVTTGAERMDRAAAQAETRRREYAQAAQNMRIHAAKTDAERRAEAGIAQLMRTNPEEAQRQAPAMRQAARAVGMTDRFTNGLPWWQDSVRDAIGGETFDQMPQETQQALFRYLDGKVGNTYADPNTLSAEMPKLAAYFTQADLARLEDVYRGKGDPQENIYADQATMYDYMARLEAMPVTQRQLFERMMDMDTGANDYLAAREQLASYMGGHKELDRLISAYQRHQNEARVQQEQADFQRRMEESPGGVYAENLATPFYSVGAAITEPVGIAGEWLSRLTGTSPFRTGDPNAEFYKLSDKTAMVRGATSDAILGDDPNFGRKVANTLYSGAMSALDNGARLAAGLITGSPYASLALAGTGSFSSSYRDATARGADPLRAGLYGGANAALEIVTEKIPLDRLLTFNASGLKGKLVDILVTSPLTEIGEEEASYFGGLLADAIIMGQSSNNQIQIRQLMESGMSEAEAREAVFNGIVAEALETAATSYVSSGLMTGTKYAFGGRDSGPMDVRPDETQGPTAEQMQRWLSETTGETASAAQGEVSVAEGREPGTISDAETVPNGGETTQEQRERWLREMYPQDDGVRYSYAGRQAATADTGRLAQAEQLELQGKTNEEIRQETGWFRGMDGKWRFEIDDSRAEFRRDGDAKLMEEPGYRRLQELTEKWAAQGGDLPDAEMAEMESLQDEYEDKVWAEKYTLPDFLFHEKLYKAYPQLKYASVVFEDLPSGVNGQYDTRSNTVVLANNLLGAPESTLLHEIQHAIQRIEGFTHGASPGYWKFMTQSADDWVNESILRNRAKDLRAQMDKLGEESGLNAYLDELFEKTLADEITEDEEAALERKYIQEHVPEYATMQAELDDIYHRLKGISARKKDVNALYRNTAGEIEARDTAARRNLDAEGRKKMPPDLGDEKTVFADAGGVVHSANGQDYSSDYVYRRLNQLQGMLFREAETPVFSTSKGKKMYVTVMSGGKYRLTSDPSNAAPIDEVDINDVKAYVQRMNGFRERRSDPLTYAGTERVSLPRRMPHAERTRIQDEIATLRGGLSTEMQAKAKQDRFNKDRQAVAGSYFEQKAIKGEPFVFAGNGEVVCNYQSAVRTIVAAAKQMGATEVYTSSKSGSKFGSSVYLRLGDREIRISDHNLPMTDTRTDRGGFRWDYDLVLTNGLMIDLAQKIRTKADMDKFVSSLFSEDHDAKFSARETRSETEKSGHWQAEAGKVPVRQWTQGKVTFDGDESRLTKTQKTNMAGLRVVAEALNVPIHVFESKVDPETGKRIGANGWYDPKDGSIHIDLHAGRDGAGLMMFTASHELVHLIRDRDERAYRSLRGFLAKNVLKYNMERLISQQIQNAREMGRTISRDVAEEEVVANSMETMLLSKYVFRTMQELRNHDKGLWDKIKAFFENLSHRIRSAYKNLRPDSEEGRIVGAMADKADWLARLFIASSKQAADLMQNTGMVNLDSDGRTLSPSQADYFRDSVVRDNQGRLKVVYHGSGATFTEFAYDHVGKSGLHEGLGFYFTDDRSVAERYATGPDGRRGTENGSVYDVYLNVSKPMSGDKVTMPYDAYARFVKAARELGEKHGILPQFGGRGDYERGYSDVDLVNAIMYRGFADKGSAVAQEFLSTLREATGYDGIAVKNPTWGGEQTIYLAFFPEQIKLVDNKTPTTSRDMRFSVRNPGSSQKDKTKSQLEAENRKLRESLEITRELLKLQGKVTGGKVIRQTSVATVARDLMQKTGAKGSTKDLTDLLTPVYTYIAGGDVLTWEGIVEAAAPAVRWIQEHTPVTLDPYAEEVLATLKGRRVSLNQTQKQEVISQYGTMADFRRALSGAVVVSDKDATPIDSFFSEMSSMYPDLFSEDQSDAGLGLELADIVDRLRNMESADSQEMAYYATEVESDLIRQIYEGYWDVAPLKTVADKYQTKLNDLAGRYWSKMDAIRVANREEQKRLRQQIATQRKAISSQDAKTRRLEKALSVATNTIADLKERLSLQGTVTDGTKHTAKSIADSAARLMKATGATGNVDELETVLRQFYESLDHSKDLTRKEEDFVRQFVADSAETVVRWLEDHTGEGVDADVLSKLVTDSYLSSPTITTVADKYQAKLQKQQEKHRAEMWRLEEAIKRRDVAIRKRIDRDNARRESVRDSKNRTELRHKIANTVRGLNDLLLKGTKDRNVPLWLQKPVAELLDAIDMDTATAEQKLATLRKKLADPAINSDPEKVKKTVKSIEYWERVGGKVADRLGALTDAYRKIKESSDPAIASGYDENVEAYLQRVKESVGETPIADMTADQLELVYRAVKMTLTAVRNANKSFKRHRGLRISGMVDQVTRELRPYAEGGKKFRSEAGIAASKAHWNNYKPIFAFRRIGSKMLTELYESIRDGEDVAITDIHDAHEFKESVVRKYGADKWDFERKFEFTTLEGKRFSLTLNEVFTMYAYSKRGEQATDHLIGGGGGFVFDKEIARKVEGKAGKQRSTDYTAYGLDFWTFDQIIATLSEDQRAFADDMQKYLSEVMGAKGNEVSEQLYGIDLFGKKSYFPIVTAREYMAKSKDQEKGEAKLKNMGFTKATQPDARNPIVLKPFTEVWAEHVVQMGTYHGLVLPMEDFYRVYGRTQQIQGGDESVQALLGSAYGPAAIGYIDQLLKDINGSTKSDSRAELMNKLISMHKKASTMASLSVLVQQRTSQARAWAVIEPKYFPGKPLGVKAYAQMREEMMRNAPIARIKAIGAFDTGVGRSFKEYILKSDYVGFEGVLKGIFTDSDFRNELLGKLASLADEQTWVAIYRAASNKALAEGGYEPGSEEHKRATKEIFTQCVTMTQVYDSVFARSGFLRSKDTAVKMAVSFMNEPTVIVNMVEDAIRHGKRGDKKYARRALGATITSVLINCAVSSLVYATRDDDEDQNYWEKYVEALTGSLLDSFNPVTYIPFARDIMSLLDGYSVDRADMTIPENLIKAFSKVFSDNRGISAYDRFVAGAGAILDVFGIPLKNIERDLSSLWNTFTADTGEKTIGIPASIRKGLPAWLDKIVPDTSTENGVMEAYQSGLYGWDKAEKALNRLQYLEDKAAYTDNELHWLQRQWDTGLKQTDHIDLAVLSGDMAAMDSASEELKAYSDNPPKNPLKSSILRVYKDSLKPKDERNEAYGGKTLTWEKAYKLLTEAAGLRDYQAYTELERAEYAAENGDDAGFSVYNGVFGTMVNGGDIAGTVDKLVKAGFAEEQVLGETKGKVTQAYKDGELSKSQVTAILKKYYGVTDQKELYQYFGKAEYEAQGYGDSYSAYKEVYASVAKGGDISAQVNLLTQNGYTEQEVYQAAYTEVRRLYKEGEISEEKAQELMRKYYRTTEDLSAAEKREYYDKYGKLPESGALRELTEDELYWKWDEWKWTKENPNGEYSKYQNWYAAIESGENLRQVAKDYDAHGVTKSTLSRMISDRYKQAYLDAYFAKDSNEASRIRKMLVKAYISLGYSSNDAYDKLKEWVEAERKYRR